MNEQTSQTAGEQAAGFQNIWLETISKTMQAAFTFTPNSPPPEIVREIRGGIFRALEESWEKFLRSPEFLETTKQWMQQSVSFRKATNGLLGKVRHEMQAPSMEDVDTIMLAIRHMEKRILDRVDQLAEQLNGADASRVQKPNRSRRARPASHMAKMAAPASGKKPLQRKRSSRQTRQSP